MFRRVVMAGSRRKFGEKVYLAWGKAIRDS